MNLLQLVELADAQLAKRGMLLSLWQEIALNFYPERADFTYLRALGSEFAANLSTSYPVLCRRDLGDTFGTMLRPTAKSWFHVRTQDERREDIEARRWLEYAEQVMRRAMYARPTQFLKATKQGDHDFAAFGQCVLSIEPNKYANDLLFRCWHLRDCAWQENDHGDIGCFFRRWKVALYVLFQKFPKANFPTSMRDAHAKDPFAEVECLHLVVESEMADKTTSAPYVSIYYCKDYVCELENIGVPDAIYVVPRWHTVSGSQYAYSPATIAALPDGRLIQAMTATLLEAGEKYTNPPMVATQEAVRSDVAIYAGGITWVDPEYDERTGDALRPLNQDKGGMPIGVEMQRDIRAMLKESFFLNKIAMPQRAAEMTAFEVGQRVQEYIRQALPIFEPMETEYSGGVCERTFAILQRYGAFGSPHDMPKSLRGAEIVFRFESPLHDAIEAERAQKFLEGNALIKDAIAVDPNAADIVDFKVALQDALLSAGVPAMWQRTEGEIQAIQAQKQKQQATAQMIASLEQGASAAKLGSEAAVNIKALQGGGEGAAPAA